jgi:hypothetical protein
MLGRTNTGGGGGGLNFKVICNPQPSTAKENTIWVNTEKINNYYFTATQPENMADYDVWFPVGTSSPVAFNALKKNGIQVYPLYAKQYVGGTLVDKEAKSYQGSKWVDLAVYLFNQGDACTSITGGWSSSGYSFSGYTLQNMYVNGNVLVIDRNGDYIAGGGTQSPIDLTNVDTLKLDVSAFSGSPLAVGFTESKAVSFVAELEVNGTGIFTMDTSNLSGNYYLTMLFGANNGHAEIFVVCMR